MPGRSAKRAFRTVITRREFPVQAYRTKPVTKATGFVRKGMRTGYLPMPSAVKPILRMSASFVRLRPSKRKAGLRIESKTRW